jgi:hypothetical protein
MAGPMMRHGLTTVFNDAWTPWFQSLTGQSDFWKRGKKQFQALGLATDARLSSRSHSFSDTMDEYKPQSRLERTLKWSSDQFQLANLLGPWTDWAKTGASFVAGSEILRAAKAVVEGNATQKQILTLAEGNIEPHMVKRIHDSFTAEGGGETQNGTHLANTGNWADKEAARVYEGALRRDVDIGVVTPGLEKPLFLSNDVLSVIGQFKSYTAGATERILVANLQRRDAQVLQGIVFSMGLGMLSYKLNALSGGQPTSDNPADWIKEAMSRGNLFGWLEEGNAMASKAILHLPLALFL